MTDSSESFQRISTTRDGKARRCATPETDHHDMPRRNKRQSEDYDDSLERAYLSKRTKKYDDDKPRIEATRQEATTATIVATTGDATTSTSSTDAKNDANDKIERQRQKKLLRKEQNKAKTQGRKMEEQVRDQEQRELAAALRILKGSLEVVYWSTLVPHQP